MTESDYIIQHLRMDLDKLKKENKELRVQATKATITEISIKTLLGVKIHALEEALKEEWNCNKICYLRMDMDNLKAKKNELEIKVLNLEEALKVEWNCDKIEYCTRCGTPMPEPVWSDEINEYCDICAGDMGVI